MTHLETARINEALGLQIGVVREWANHLDAADLEDLEADLRELDRAVKELRSLVDALPHHHS